MIKELVQAIYDDEDSDLDGELEVKELMRQAFLAGFAASGEGYNGEYPYRDLTEELNKRFDMFIELLQR